MNKHISQILILGMTVTLLSTLSCSGDKGNSNGSDCPEAIIEEIPPICSEDGWCWQHPLPAGNSLRSLWDDGCTLYAGGFEGALVKVDLATGELISYQTLYDDLYIYEITGFEDGRLVLLYGWGDYKQIDIWDGVTLEPLPLPEGEYELVINDVEVDADGILFLTGEDYDVSTGVWHGFFARYTEEGWERIATDVESPLHEMALDNEYGIYILAGPNGYLHEYQDGCGVYYWDGESLEQDFWNFEEWYSDSCQLNGIDVSLDRTVWAAGDSGYVLTRSNSSEWDQVYIDLELPLPSGSTNPFELAFDAWAVAVGQDGEVVLSSVAGTVGWNGQFWDIFWYQNDKAQYFYYDLIYADSKFWGAGPGIMQLKLASHDIIRISEPNDMGLYKVWFAPNGELFALGQTGEYFNKSPAIWTSENAHEFTVTTFDETEDSNLLEIWGLSNVDVWACGQDGFVFHFDGESWELAETNTDAYLGEIWGSSPDNVYFANFFGSLLRWNGSDFEELNLPSQYQGNVVGLWGIDENNIFVLVDDQLLLFNGTDWSLLAEADPADQLRNVVGVAPDDLYVTGMNYVWHFDGTNLTQEDPGECYEFSKIALHEDTGDIYAICESHVDTIFRKSEGEWSEVDVGAYMPRDIDFSGDLGMIVAGGVITKEM